MLQATKLKTDKSFQNQRLGSAAAGTMSVSSTDTASKEADESFHKSTFRSSSMQKLAPFQCSAQSKETDESFQKI